MNHLTLNAALYAEMPADVAAFVKSTAKQIGVRKALVFVVAEKPNNMYAGEGEKMTAFMGGVRQSAQMVSESTIGGGDDMRIGYFSAPLGAWFVITRWFMGKQSMTIQHVGIAATPAIETAADVDALYTPVTVVAALPAQVEAAQDADAPVMPAAVRERMNSLDAAMPVEIREYPMGCVDLETETGESYFRSRQDRRSGTRGTWNDCAKVAALTLCTLVYEIPEDTWAIVQNNETGAYCARYSGFSPDWDSAAYWARRDIAEGVTS